MPRPSATFTESLISCPQKGGRIDKDRGYQACVGETDAPVVQASGLNRQPHFAQLRHPHLWQKIQQRNTISAPPHSSTTVGEGRGEPGADGTRTGPANLRSGQAGAVPAAQLHPPARA